MSTARSRRSGNAGRWQRGNLRGKDTEACLATSDDVGCDLVSQLERPGLRESSCAASAQPTRSMCVLGLDMFGPRAHKLAT